MTRPGLLPPLPEGRLLPGVRAPSGVLSSRGGGRPADPDVVTLAADLLATSRPRPGASAWPRPRSASATAFSLDVTGHPKAHACHGPLVLANPVIVQASRWERAAKGACRCPTSPAT